MAHVTSYADVIAHPTPSGALIWALICIAPMLVCLAVMWVHSRRHPGPDFTALRARADERRQPGGDLHYLPSAQAEHAGCQNPPPTAE